MPAGAPYPGLMAFGEKGLTALLPIMAVVFVAYLVVGIAMPVLPVYVHHGLGLGMFVVGLVAGSQFGASLLSRFWAGRRADAKGAKQTVILGVLVAAAAGLVYFVSLALARSPVLSAAILLAGRGALGVAESLIITGALGWALALVPAERSGKVIAWVGTALWAAFAVGAPAGDALYTRFGFGAIALATMVLPLLSLALIVRLDAVATVAHAQPSLVSVVRAIWKPGAALALSGVGFGAITTFIALFFAEQGWSAAWVALTSLSVAFIAGRVFFGHLPDRLGGARVAFICVLIEAVGQVLIWLAPGFAIALTGVTLSGLGYSLVYPGLGIEALRTTPSQQRGVVMGAYSAFLDLSLGISGPVLGLIASATALNTVFLVSTVVVLTAAPMAVRLSKATKSACSAALLQVA